MTTRAEQINSAWELFHQQNPQVWELFKRFANEARAANLVRYSAKAIYERIRWHLNVELKVAGDAPAKLNNNFHSRYARLYNAEMRLRPPLFEERRSTNKEISDK